MYEGVYYMYIYKYTKIYGQYKYIMLSLYNVCTVVSTLNIVLITIYSTCSVNTERFLLMLVHIWPGKRARSCYHLTQASCCSVYAGGSVSIAFYVT